MEKSMQPSLINYWIASFKTWLAQKDIEKSWKSGKFSANILNILKATGNMREAPPDYSEPHPLFAERLKQMKADWPGTAPHTFLVLAAGDSILNMGRESFTAFQNKANLGQSGAWHYQTWQIEQEALKILDSIYQGGREIVKAIFLGTNAGNPLIAGQSYDVTLERCQELWNRTRAALPNAKIIIFTIPPTYSIWANAHRARFELDAWDWVSRDKNAVLVTFKNFGGFVPSIVLGSDTVHLNERGKYRLNELFLRALAARPGTYIQ